jgi:ATP-binding protein involved in chromosome partitioning
MNNLAGVKHLIAVHSGKGGVGKSTMALNLAVATSRLGARVGLIDADIHGPSLSLMMGNRARPQALDEKGTEIAPIKAHGIGFISMGNLVHEKTPLIWRGPNVHRAIMQFLNQVRWGELDYLFIDMPPGTGDAVLSLCQAAPLSGAVIVTTPQDLAVADTARGIHTFTQLKVPIIGIIENMAYFVCDGCDDRVSLFGSDGSNLFTDELGIPTLAQIPIEPGVSLSGDQGKPMVLAFPDSACATGVLKAAETLMRDMAERKTVAGIELEWRQMAFTERYDQPSETLSESGSEINAIWQVSADELGLRWKDGFTAIFGARELRINCPCASCVDEDTGVRTLKPEMVPNDVTIAKVKGVGRYAIAPTFTDGHNTGIFHFAKLREHAEAKAGAQS